MSHDLSVLSRHDEMKDGRVKIKFMRCRNYLKSTNTNKANRGNGIWVSMINILPPADKKECVYNNKLLEIGCKCDDHNSIEKPIPSKYEINNDSNVRFYS